MYMPYTCPPYKCPPRKKYLQEEWEETFEDLNMADLEGAHANLIGIFRCPLLGAPLIISLQILI